MPKLTLYSFWIPDLLPPMILIAGDTELHSLFIKAFPDLQVDESYTSPPKSPSHKMYDYTFHVHNAKQTDRRRIETWLKKYKTNTIELVSLKSNSLDRGYALSYHDGPIWQLVSRAKPYDKTATSQTTAAALTLVEIMIQHLSYLEETNYFVAIPYLNKPFDLPEFITNEICKKTSSLNGSHFVEQTREKQYSQKDLHSPEEKRDNVKGLFKITKDHPFSGKVITIIDDIYRSGTTIDELVKVLREAGAKSVQAFVLTKTFRD